MEITCPNPDCGKKFDWEPPGSSTVIKLETVESVRQETKKKRYTTECPHCETRVSISL